MSKPPRLRSNQKQKRPQNSSKKGKGRGADKKTEPAQMIEPEIISDQNPSNNNNNVEAEETPAVISESSPQHEPTAPKRYVGVKTDSRVRRLEAFKADLARERAQERNRTAGSSSTQIFEKPIRLDAKAFDIYHRLKHRGGNEAPSWNDFVWLMKQIFGMTGGRIITHGGSSHTFEVGDRKFSVHRPSNVTQQIPESYLRGFIIPGMNYVGLTDEQVLPE